MWFKTKVDRVALLTLAFCSAGVAAIPAAQVQAQVQAHVQTQPQGSHAIPPSRLAQRRFPRTLLKQASTSRKRPKPVRLPGGWFVTRRGAGSRLSCANYKLMEVVEAEGSDRPGFAVQVPYSAAELKNLEFILQTENYEELHRVPLALESASEARFVALPLEVMQQRTDSSYRWFVEATIVCQSEVDEPLDLEPVESAVESVGVDEAIAAEPILDTRKSSIGGWIEREVEPQSPESSVN